MAPARRAQIPDRRVATVCRLFGLSGGSERIRATFWLLEAPDGLAAESRRSGALASHPAVVVASEPAHQLTLAELGNRAASQNPGLARA
jgi:hypothetical protein